MATQILLEAARARWEPHALDVLPGGCDVCVRLGGSAPALQDMATDILARWPGEKLTDADAQKLWSDLREFRWTDPQGPLIKIALTPAVLPAFYRGLQKVDGVRAHVSAGGNVAFVSLPANSWAPVLNDLLRDLSLSAVTLRGDAPLWCGLQSRPKIAQAVKQALDPENRFPGLDE
jgi:hypothetical protein